MGHEPFFLIDPFFLDLEILLFKFAKKTIRSLDRVVDKSKSRKLKLSNLNDIEFELIVELITLVLAFLDFLVQVLDKVLHIVLLDIVG